MYSSNLARTDDAYDRHFLSNTSIAPIRVKFNVGGRVFETTSTTIETAGPRSFLSTLLKNAWKETCGEIFIDRNPDCFAILLDFLRTGDVYIPTSVPRDLLYREADFYGLSEQLRQALRGTLNGNFLRASESIKNSFFKESKTICASPTGGLCFAHKNIVRSFNHWNLEEQPPICLNNSVNDLIWCNSQHMVISTSEDLGVFDSMTGTLTDHFFCEKVDDNVLYGSLCANLEDKIFSTFMEKDSGKSIGIGQFDRVSGQQSSFIELDARRQLGTCKKLQWISGSNCLFAFFRGINNSSVFCLVDRRENERMVSYCAQPRFRQQKIVDAAVDYEGNICIMDIFQNVGFLDIRQFKHEWMSRTLSMEDKEPPESILCHNGQMFARTKTSILVLSGPEMKLTSKVKPSCGGLIYDISIGGDRLFALCNDEDLVHVWETPRTLSAI